MRDTNHLPRATPLIPDHGELTGLADDDHTQYVLLDGRGNAQIITGAVNASGELALTSTSDVTKGLITLGRFGLGCHVQVGGGTNQSELRIMEAAGSGTNYVSFKAPTLSGNVNYVLPTDDGDANEVLTTNGSGTLSWEPVSGEANLGANVGAGGGNVFRDKTGVTLNFRTLTTALSGPSGAAINGISADTSGDTFRVVYTMTSPSAPSSPSGPGGSSLHPDSLIEMSDGRFEWLCDIRIGDKVRGVNGEEAEVLGIWRNVLNERPLWFVNGVAVTAGHLFKTREGWACCSAAEYRKRYGDHYILKTSRGYVDINCGIVHPDEVLDLVIGMEVLVVGGEYMPIATLESFSTQGGDNKVPAAQEVISLYLDNAKAYYCDGYAVSTIA